MKFLDTLAHNTYDGGGGTLIQCPIYNEKVN